MVGGVEVVHVREGRHGHRPRAVKLDRRCTPERRPREDSVKPPRPARDRDLARQVVHTAPHCEQPNASRLHELPPSLSLFLSEASLFNCPYSVSYDFFCKESRQSFKKKKNTKNDDGKADLVS